MSELMEVDYELTRDDLYAFQLRATQVSPVARRARRKLYIYLFLAVFLLAIVPAIGADGFVVSRVSFGFLLIFYPLVAGITWLLEKRLTRRTILELLKEEVPEKGQLGKHKVMLDDSGVLEGTAVGQSRTSWAGINRVEQSPDYIYIYTTPSAAFVIPRRAFAGAREADDFYQFASSRNGRQP
jgi:hypothetical protein